MKNAEKNIPRAIHSSMIIVTVSGLVENEGFIFRHAFDASSRADVFHPFCSHHSRFNLSFSKEEATRLQRGQSLHTTA